jgi:peptidoglycan/LPS O-acetylase OafA/YrhL
MLNSTASRLPTYKTYRATRHFAALDGLRAFSVIAVIWQHTAGFNAGKGILARGYLGVDCFFVISGFLITTLLLRERSQTGSISLKRFYLRRAARIFPVYYLVLSVYLALVLIAQIHTKDGREFLHNLPFFATYTSNWFAAGGNHATFYFAWSLATEEQFYLFWPPLLVACLHFGIRAARPTAKRWLIYPVGILGSLIVLDQVAASSDWRIVASLATAILLGALAAVVMHDPRGYEMIVAGFSFRWTAVFGVGLTLFMIQFEFPDVAVQVCFLYLLIALVVREDTVLHPLLRWRPIVLVGTVSYGIYLMHMLAANLVRPIVGHHFGIMLFAGTLPVATVAAYLSFRWFESPVREAVRARQHEAPHTR